MLNLLISSQRSEGGKGKKEPEVEQIQSHKALKVIENMKSNTILRPRSNDKINGSNSGTTLGSTGGSQSFTQNSSRRHNIKLSSNIMNNSSIAIPQTTQNTHSSRMQNYQNPHSQNTTLQTLKASMTNRNCITSSTPKNQPSLQSSNFSSTLLQQAKHRQQLSNSQIKQGLQGSQGTSTSTYNSVSSTTTATNGQTDMQALAQKIINQQQITQNDLVKVGTLIPKTTTAANLRNFNNLRQFNHILNQNKHGSHHHNQKSIGETLNEVLAQKQNEINSQAGSSMAQQQSSKGLLQNHQRHLQQQQQQQLLKSSGIQDKQQQKISGNSLINEKSAAMLKAKPKNLQISIPSSPRNGDENQGKQQEQQQIDKPNVHAGSLSTTNSGQGNIKLTKFTCHSTRNNANKQNMFQQTKRASDQEYQEQKEPQKLLEMNNGEEMPLQPAHKIIIPNHESTKHSLKRNGVVRAYAANTNQGLVRNYNEDRVSIILNILKPPNRKDENWPRCSFFGIYDGHGGAACADYLRDNLHQFVIKEPSFPSNPKEALKNGFANAEKKFLEHCQNEQGVIDKSGSCAIVALIVEDMCYIANVGDSRAILSSRTATNTDQNNPNKKDVIVGPLRVLPGRLSVSRTFGDIEAKLEKYGGNPNVVVATPEIKSFKIQSEHDFIVLGCDGIFDKLSNKDTMQCVWNSVADNKNLNFASNIHKQSGMGVEYILKNSLLRRTLDNVTVVLIAFNNFKHSVFGQTKQRSKHNNNKLQNSKSNDNSNENQQNHNKYKKENIPPPSISGNSGDAALGKTNKAPALGINTNQCSNSQGPKTTTNAQLQRELQAQQIQQQLNINQQQVQKRMNPGMTSNNQKARHFDFSNV